MEYKFFLSFKKFKWNCEIGEWNASWRWINIIFNENADLDNSFVTASVLGKFNTSREILYIRST